MAADVGFDCCRIMNTAQLSRNYPPNESLIVRGEGVDDISAFILLSRRMETGGGRGDKGPAKRPVLISPQVSLRCLRDGMFKTYDLFAVAFGGCLY